MNAHLDGRARRVDRSIDDLRQRCPAHSWQIHHDSDLLWAFGHEAVEAHDPRFLRFAAAKISAQNFEHHATNAAQAFLVLADRFDRKQAEAGAWRERYDEQATVVEGQVRRIQWLEGELADERVLVARMREEGVRAGMAQRTMPMVTDGYAAYHTGQAALPGRPAAAAAAAAAAVEHQQPLLQEVKAARTASVAPGQHSPLVITNGGRLSPAAEPRKGAEIPPCFQAMHGSKLLADGRIVASTRVLERETGSGLLSASSSRKSAGSKLVDSSRRSSSSGVLIADVCLF